MTEIKKLTKEQKEKAIKMKEELFVDLDALLKGASKKFKDAGMMGKDGEYGYDSLWIRHGFAIIAIRRTEDSDKNEANQMVLMNPNVLKDSLQQIVDSLADSPECTDPDCPGHGEENRKKAAANKKVVGEA